ncbi:ubiquitin C-terminal hydrolase 15-like [Typha angustifolia]|uniref:ubiquitin C-terminal hydrolase 15-like n=1 Tax=Typha angustifolia TaxID=59011 RepID=UPI003C2D698C
MLQPREANIPALFLFFVVLPLVSYICLGKWNEATKKKARIIMLAQLAAEEAHRVETMACADVMPVGPSLRNGFHECARCLAPAITRCSRCKSVRYCSGKCQIIHWRLGHKQECQKWHDGVVKASAGFSVVEAVQQQPLLNDLDSLFPGIDTKDSKQSALPCDLSDDMSVMTTATSQDSVTTSNLSHRRATTKLSQVIYKSGSVPCVFDETNDYSEDDSTLFTEISPKDASFGHESMTGKITPFGDTHSNQDTCSDFVKEIQQNSYSQITSPGKAGISVPSQLDKNTTNECETGSHITSNKVNCCESGFSSTLEKVDRSLAKRSSTKGSMMNKKPPYTLKQTDLRSQNSADKREYTSQGIERNACKKNESRVAQVNGSVNDQLQGNGISYEGDLKIQSSKGSPKFLKRNLVGLINDNKKNKMIQMLFPYEDLMKFFQCEVWGISPRGLLNCGNSCYANAVLQCLTCTKPLMIYLLRRLHSRSCWAKDWCLMCELEQHVSMLREGGGPLSPSRILSNMRSIGCRLGGGSQEDAHEFLRLLVMSMQSTCLEALGGEKEVDPRLQETTLIQQIFGGRLKSKVKCLRCHLESERYENIMDLTLEIHGWVESLEDALTQFTAPEDLDGENMYRCGGCCAYVKARKQLSVHEVPNILTIVLKRFQTGKYGKINKCVTFPDMLDMIPFVTGAADSPPLYLLYAVVVHLDSQNASFTGHYVSYVKDLQGTWLRIDDSEVQTVPLSQVMSEGAYMLFYSRSSPRPPRIYIEKAPLYAPVSTKRNTSKPHQNQTDMIFVSKSPINERDDLRPENREGVKGQNIDFTLSSRSVYPIEEIVTDSISLEFSDATSSDCSLFTSSDESSIATESTRDSFSTVDIGDNASLDPISSIFSPMYGAEYSHSNVISCTESSSCRPETRFFSAGTAYVSESWIPIQPVGSVHRGRIPEKARASSAEPFVSASNSRLHGKYWSNLKDGLVHTSGFCEI